jgi:hypothetical protein
VEAIAIIAFLSRVSRVRAPRPLEKSSKQQQTIPLAHGTPVDTGSANHSSLNARAFSRATNGRAFGLAIRDGEIVHEYARISRISSAEFAMQFFETYREDLEAFFGTMQVSQQVGQVQSGLELQ